MTRAEAADLEMRFPTKTDMYIQKEFVAFKVGYGEDYVEHYPLDDNKWAVTTLPPRDFGTILEDIKSGKLSSEPGLYDKYSITKDPV